MGPSGCASGYRLLTNRAACASRTFGSAVLHLGHSPASEGLRRILAIWPDDGDREWLAPQGPGGHARQRTGGSASVILVKAAASGRAKAHGVCVAPSLSGNQHRVDLFGLVDAGVDQPIGRLVWNRPRKGWSDASSSRRRFCLAIDTAGSYRGVQVRRSRVIIVSTVYPFPNRAAERSLTAALNFTPVRVQQAQTGVFL